MKSLKFIYPTISLLFLLVLGCSSDECLQNKNALPLAGFYNSSSPSSKISLDSLQVYGMGVPGDSILFAGNSSINELYLPFRLDRDTTAYIFKYLHSRLAQQNIADTIRFVYSRTPRFVSSACGVSYIFRLKTIISTDAFIDSVSCPYGEITNMDTENLHIYFRVNNE